MILADGLRAGKGGFDAPRSDSDGGGGESGYVDTPRWAPVRRYDFGKEKKNMCFLDKGRKEEVVWGCTEYWAPLFCFFLFFLGWGGCCSGVGCAVDGCCALSQLWVYAISTVFGGVVGCGMTILTSREVCHCYPDMGLK